MGVDLLCIHFQIHCYPMPLPRKILTVSAILASVFILPRLAAEPIRIAPIGDSITQGRGGSDPTYSYRYPLWKILIDAGVDFDFVGSLKVGFNGSPNWAPYNGIPFDLDHEGHWGWRADAIRDSLPSWLAGYTPDIALILLGTNDWSRDNSDVLSHTQSANKTKEDIRGIINTLRADNPNVIILLGDPFQEWNPFPAYRSAFAALAQEENTEASPIINVAHAPGWVSSPELQGTHTVDWVHPNQAGDLHLAERWYAALFPWLAVNWAAWQEWYFSGQAQLPVATKGFDADNDGLSNLVEYALGTDPTHDDAEEYGPQMVIQDDTLHYTFARDTRLAAIRTRVEQSSDLSTWETIFDSDEVAANNNGNHHTVSIPLGEMESCFVRLVVEDK